MLLVLSMFRNVAYFSFGLYAECQGQTDYIITEVDFHLQ